MQHPLTGVNGTKDPVPGVLYLRSCICEGSGYLYLPRCKWMWGYLGEIEETQSYRPRRGQRATDYGRTIPRRHFSDGNDPMDHWRLRNGFFAKPLIRESEPQLVAESEAAWIRASSESEN